MPSSYDEITVDDSEFEQMARMLEEFPASVEQQMLEKATGAGAIVFQLALIEKARVRESERTPGSTSLPKGYVKADVRVQKLKSRVDGMVGWLIGPSSLTAHVWRWLEFGHRLARGGQLPWSGTGRRRNRGGHGKEIGHVPAEPFIRPAFDEYWKTSYDVTVKRLGELIADYWRQGWKKVA